MLKRVMKAIFQINARKPNANKERENWQPPLSSLQDKIDIDEFIVTCQSKWATSAGGRSDHRGPQRLGFDLGPDEFREFTSLVSRNDVLRIFQLTTWGGLALVREGRVIAHWNTVHYQPREYS